MSESNLPLAGLRVVDAADERGELCGRMLADFGADVIRIEPPGGALSRTKPPFAPDGQSLFFGYRNFNKRSVVVDLETIEGRSHLQELVDDADVFIESALPGAMAALGLGPDEVAARNARLIYCSLTSFGQTGPYAGYQATDDVVTALSGWLASSGIPEKPPLLPPGSLAFDTLGVHGLFAVLTALVARAGTGKGQHLDVSALEALAQMNTWSVPNVSTSLHSGTEPSRLRSGVSPMYAMYPTLDGAVRLVILAARQWHAMFEWMGRPEVFADPSWEQTITRMMNLDILNPFFAEHFAPMTMEAAAKEAQRRGVVVTPMLGPEEVLKNEHYASRHTFVDAEIADGVNAPVAAGFMEIDAERMGYRDAPPSVGEHQDASFTADPWASRTSSAVSGGRPLAGLRVMDFGHGGVGVEGGRMLVEYGAEVIKIESRSYPDFIRLVLGTEMTPSFASSSRSKKSLGVNLKDPRGRDLLLKLAESSHIVIENNSTGTMDNLGLGYKALHAANPDLVMVSSQMMGSRGAYGEWIGYGPTIQTVGGLNWLWAFDDGEGPPGNPAIHPDHLAGRLCAIGGLVGWLSGSGHHVEIAQVEALINTLGDIFAKEGLAPGSVRPEGNDDERGAPWGVFPCAGEQQWAVVCIRNDDDWTALVDVMGTPEWARDTAFSTGAGRLADRAAVNAGLAEWTSGRTPREVMDLCQAKGVPAAAMLDTVDQLTDPQVVARGFIVPVEQQDLGPISLEGPGFFGSDMAPALIEQAPKLGEHTRVLATEVLGLSTAEVDELIEAGVLEVSG